MTMAALSTAKLRELPLRNTIPLSSHSPSSLHFLFFYSPPNSTLSLFKSFSSLRTTTQTNARLNGVSQNPKTNKPRYPWDQDPQNPTKNPNPNPNSKSSSAPWLNKWPSANPPVQSHPLVNSKVIETKRSEGDDRRVQNGNAGTSAIERIVLRLRNLGLGSDDDEEEDGNEENLGDISPAAATGDEKLGDLLKRDWVRPDVMLKEEEDETLLPWEKEGERREAVEEEDGRGVRRRTAKAPSLAELTIADEELRRLRREGMTLRERVSVAKAGVTGAVLEKIHEKWRKSELVRLKFHETLAHDMKTAHEIVEVGGF